VSNVMKKAQIDTIDIRHRLTLFIIHFSVSSVFSVAKNLFVPQCLCGYESIMQNKPNSLKSQIFITSI
jgi:hypothetical protein